MLFENKFVEIRVIRGQKNKETAAILFRLS